ncbi:MAG: 4Fe-4S dicluster domain-containing protein [Candidatus Bathyarchaeia archaeon]|jgi:Fe-S-cluster-containing hydrogenase component 2
MKRILVNVDRCSGCRLCELACSFTHEKRFGPSASRVTVMKEDGLGFDLPVICWHCDHCKPAESCLANALERNAEGLICVDEEKCTGCGNCVELCPSGAIKLHPNKHTPLLCDQCDGRPLCVEKCPTKALTYAETRTQQPKSANRVLEETLRRWRVTV